MNKLLHFLFFTLILIGCGKDKLENQNDFEKAMPLFKNLKKKQRTPIHIKQLYNRIMMGLFASKHLKLLKGW